MSISKAENLAVQSVVAAGVFEAVDKFYYGNPIDIKKAALMAGSHASSGYIADMFSGSNNVVNSVDKVYLQPIVSGGVYSFASGPSLLGWDYRSYLLKFILAAGSSGVANYASEPIQSFLGL